jgi:hypothetical protein
MKRTLVVAPKEKKDRGLTQFNIDTETIQEGVAIFNEMYPNRFDIIGVSRYLGKEEDFKDRLLY